MKMRKERNINIGALEEKNSRVLKKFGSKVDVKKHQYAGSNILPHFMDIFALYVGTEFTEFPQA